MLHGSTSSFQLANNTDPIRVTGNDSVRSARRSADRGGLREAQYHHTRNALSGDGEGGGAEAVN